MIWEAVWRKAPFPFSSLNVRMFKLQSFSTGVLRSTISPSISPAVAALASPSLISAAISMTDFASGYSFTEPSFKVIFIISFLLLIFHFYPCFPARKKNLVPSAFRQKGRGIDSRGSTLFEPASLPEPLHFDDNGITGPDWGHSEVVFKCFRDRRLPAYISLSGTFHILLFSSTCCLSFSILYPTLGLCQPSFSHKNLKQKK